MKTTIDIADPLLSEAKEIARAEGATLRELVEEGLRKVVEERRSPAVRFRLRPVTFRGKGLQPPLTDLDWDTIRALVYEGHGG